MKNSFHTYASKGDIMKCPSCENDLTQMVAGDVTVDVCRGGCGGVWFDRFEMQKFDEPDEHAGEALIDIEKDESVRIDHSQRRTCPKCGDILMLRHFYSPKREIEIDECPKCGGFWLDAGELAALREQYKTEEERRRAADEYVDELFGDQLEKMKAQNEAELAKVQRIARMFRFICPSYYIPGKQTWGAF
jgi:Zn-finger nucleic acid-binding protein